MASVEEGEEDGLYRVDEGKRGGRDGDLGDRNRQETQQKPEDELGSKPDVVHVLTIGQWAGAGNWGLPR